MSKKCCLSCNEEIGFYYPDLICEKPSCYERYDVIHYCPSYIVYKTIVSNLIFFLTGIMVG